MDAPPGRQDTVNSKNSRLRQKRMKFQLSHFYSELTLTQEIERIERHFLAVIVLSPPCPLPVHLIVTDDDDDIINVCFVRV